MVPPPVSAVALLLLANVVVYGASASAGLGLPVPGSTLFADGAIYAGALAPGERWRLIAAVFLHANPAHLVLNMFSLLMIGPALERKIGAANFLVIYFVAALGGSIASVALHHEAFLGVGASGALFGLLGAFLALWVLGDHEISPAFFLVNFGMNFAFSTSARNIDFLAHVGGFAGGLLACASLDLVARVNRFWLRCRFPEFVRMSVLLIVVGLTLTQLSHAPPRFEAPMLAAISLAGGLVVAKGLDLALSIRRGVALVIVFLATMAGLTGYLLADNYAAAWPVACLRALTLVSAKANICSYVKASPEEIGFVVGLLALLANVQQFARGIADKGFLAASLRGERRRTAGL